MDFIHPLYRPYIEATPFVALATYSADGMDVSPRGDEPGFIHIEDDHTLLLPDRRGNNRIDSMRNLLINPAIALLVLVPGINETLRINGHAEILIDEETLARFKYNNALPRSVLRIHVERVFFQCGRALIRSGLWENKYLADKSTIPAPGQILKSISHQQFDGDKYDAQLPERIMKTLY
ncbi:pyridoxamine 5'-phosphate oxidase family protein [Proteus mirabilis]